MQEIRHILLVEDEKAIREAVAAYLERENYKVTTAVDGQEALDEFDKRHFDLIVLDRMLPRVSGDEVCLTVREIGRAHGSVCDNSFHSLISSR
ncbi:MAG: response regulator [Coriobacteriales bacterium]|nr:response regulator [Coriobacteriales bacterium]